MWPERSPHHYIMLMGYLLNWWQHKTLARSLNMAQYNGGVSYIIIIIALIFLPSSICFYRLLYDFYNQGDGTFPVVIFLVYSSAGTGSCFFLLIFKDVWYLGICFVPWCTCILCLCLIEPSLTTRVYLFILLVKFTRASLYDKNISFLS